MTLLEALILGFAMAGAVSIGGFVYDLCRFLRHRMLARIPMSADAVDHDPSEPSYDY